MFSKNKQDHVASLETSAKADNHNEEKKPMQRHTHSKFVDGSCEMTLILLCNHRDQHYYLSTASTLQHTHHAKLPLKAIPQNGAMLSEEQDHELLNCLFDCWPKRSEVAKVIGNVKGKDSTSIDPMTVYNLRNKSLNLINKKSGYSGDLTDPSKTMKKLKE